MESSKIYYGGTFLDDKDLEESKLSNRIELEYYTTRTYNNKLKEDSEMYGIEIVKKEYEEKGVKIELESIEKVCNNPNKINEIIDTLKRCKVTPVGLYDVVNDIIKKEITE